MGGLRVCWSGNSFLHLNSCWKAQQQVLDKPEKVTAYFENFSKLHATRFAKVIDAKLQYLAPIGFDFCQRLTVKVTDQSEPVSAPLFLPFARWRRGSCVVCAVARRDVYKRRRESSANRASWILPIIETRLNVVMLHAVGFISWKKIKSKAHAGVPASPLRGQKGLFSSDGTAKPVCECCKSEPCVCVCESVSWPSRTQELVSQNKNGV